MEWSNEVIMEFLDLYESEPIIWDPVNTNHKDRNKVYDAWKNIQSKFSLECSLKELKKKKENLMATFRKLSLKVKKTTTTGSGASQVYRPEWFAYDKMASFLNSVYAPRNTKSSEMESPEHGRELDNEEVLLGNGDETTNTSDQTDTSITESAAITSESACMGPPAVTSGGPPRGKKRKAEEVAQIQKRMNDAYHFLKQVATKPKTTKDESELFCELLCVKLRNLDDETREIAMHEINNLMFTYRKSTIPNAFMQHYPQNHPNSQYHSGDTSHNASRSPSQSPSCASGASSFGECENNLPPQQEGDCAYGVNLNNTVAELFQNFQSGHK